jgi:pyruvate dehydrogenase E2 component (dihydrolipoamide acetyltransferase)
MAIKDVPLPDIGDFDEVDVIEVLVKPGDRVEAEQSLITLESEKATMEVPAPFAGEVKEVKVSAGDKIAEGQVIATVDDAESEGKSGDGDEPSDEGEKAEDTEPSESEGADETEEARPSDEKAAKDKPESDRADWQARGGRSEDTAAEGPREPPLTFEAEDILPEKVPHASPAVRRFARELGVDLNQVQGSGPKGRIRREDVQKHVKGVMEGGAAAPAGEGLAVASPPKVDFEKFGPVETEPMGRIQRLSASNLHRNWVSIPHVTQHDEADITDLEAFRKAHQKEAEARDAKLTLLAFLIRASVSALQAFPRFNASLDPGGEELILKRYFHIGVAVDTPNGLVVPVLRDCDQKGLIELAVELGEISEKARAGKLSPGEMQGGCFSISSLGGIGGTAFTPIVNMPEVAILGVSRASMKPMWNGEEFEPRLTLPLSLSYDHRVIDGAGAARFTRYLAEALTDMRRVLL